MRAYCHLMADISSGQARGLDERDGRLICTACRQNPFLTAVSATPATGSRPRRTAEELQLDLLAFELTERRFDLCARAVLLVLAALLATIGLVAGTSWHVLVAAGGGSATLAAFERQISRRGKRYDPARP